MIFVSEKQEWKKNEVVIVSGNLTEVKEYGWINWENLMLNISISVPSPNSYHRFFLNQITIFPSFLKNLKIFPPDLLPIHPIRYFSLDQSGEPKQHSHG